MTLSRTDRSALVRLLGILQDHLESAIETSIVISTGEPMPGDTAHIASVAKDRRDWRTAEDMLKKLQVRASRRAVSKGSPPPVNAESTGYSVEKTPKTGEPE